MSAALLRPCPLFLLFTAAFLVEFIGCQSCQPSTTLACSSFVDGTFCFFLPVFSRLPILLTTHARSCFSVGTPIFIPANLTLATAEHVTNSQSNLVNFHPIPEPCRSDILRLICSTWPRPCAKDANGKRGFRYNSSFFFFFFFARNCSRPVNKELIIIIMCRYIHSRS